MAMDYVLSTGDLLVIVPQFGKATVTVPPAPLIGTGSVLTVGMVPMQACVEGDEFPVVLRAPLPYVSGNYIQPGAGLLSIELEDSHWTKVMTCKGKKLLRVGGTVKAKFQVTVPATQPTYPGVTPDSTTEYESKGKYVTTKNIFFKAA